MPASTVLLYFHRIDVPTSVKLYHLAMDKFTTDLFHNIDVIHHRYNIRFYMNYNIVSN